MIKRSQSLADPDFELRRGPGFILLAQSGFLPSVISYFFTQNRGKGLEPPGPSPRSATDSDCLDRVIRQIRLYSALEDIPRN